MGFSFGLCYLGNLKLRLHVFWELGNFEILGLGDQDLGFVWGIGMLENYRNGGLEDFVQLGSSSVWTRNTLIIISVKGFESDHV